MNKLHVSRSRYREFQRIIQREFWFNNSNVLLRFRTVEKIRTNCCRINRVQRSSRAKNKMKLASGENGSSNRRKLDVKSGSVKLLTTIRLETCVLHRRRDEGKQKIGKKDFSFAQEFRVYETNMQKIALMNKRIDFFICRIFFSTLIKIPQRKLFFFFPSQLIPKFRIELFDYSLNNLIRVSKFFIHDKQAFD